MERVLARLAPAARARGEELAARYDAAAWPGLLTRHEVRENLYVLDLLDRFLPQDLPAGRGLDVGARDGAYLPALAAAWPHGWDAVELDAHRRFLTFATRRAYGEATARALPRCRYVAGSVLGESGSYAVITWLLPFVLEEPLRAWGLPASEFQPERLLAHVVARLAPRGALLVVNQGEDEAAEQERLLAASGVRFERLGRADSVLSPFRRTRYALSVRAS